MLSTDPLILYVNFCDGITLDQSNQKWEVEDKTFSGRVKNFTPLEALAVPDAIERFWNEPQKDAGVREAKLQQPAK